MTLTTISDAARRWLPALCTALAVLVVIEACCVSSAVVRQSGEPDIHWISP